MECLQTRLAALLPRRRHRSARPTLLARETTPNTVAGEGGGRLAPAFAARRLWWTLWLRSPPPSRSRRTRRSPSRGHAGQGATQGCGARGATGKACRAHDAERRGAGHGVRVGGGAGEEGHEEEKEGRIAALAQTVANPEGRR